MQLEYIPHYVQHMQRLTSLYFTNSFSAQDFYFFLWDFNLLLKFFQYLTAIVQNWSNWVPDFRACYPCLKWIWILIPSTFPMKSSGSVMPDKSHCRQEAFEKQAEAVRTIISLWAFLSHYLIVFQALTRGASWLHSCLSKLNLGQLRRW